MVESLIGCVAGAVLVDETRAMAEAAGFVEIQLTPKSGYVDSMMDWNDPLFHKIVESLPEGAKAGDYVTSLEVAAKRRKAGIVDRRETATSYTPAVGTGRHRCGHRGQLRGLSQVPLTCGKLGVSQEDMACAVTMAQKVKEAPARAVLDLANKSRMQCLRR